MTAELFISEFLKSMTHIKVLSTIVNVQLKFVE